MVAPAPSQLDANQILPHAFDEEAGRLRVDAEVTANISGAQEVIISAEDDNIAIRSSTTDNELEPNADGSINVVDKTNLVGDIWDTISVAYPTNVQEVYTYKLGGTGGTTVATVTIDYTDTTKNYISQLVKT